MGSPFNDTPTPAVPVAAPAGPSSTAMPALNAALGMGHHLAEDAAHIAETTGNTELARIIRAGISAFSNISGPIDDIEVLSTNVLSMVTTLIHSHSALKAA